jgi:hypothetical protein
LDPLKTEAIIRLALGDKDVDAKGISSGQKYLTHGLVAIFATAKLRLAETDIDQIIVDAEKIAIERGRRPPIAI